MSFIIVKDGTAIYYKDWGNGQPIVFSHGWPLNADAWDAQMLFLGQHGFRVIAHDRRGHGRSGQTWDGKAQGVSRFPHGMPIIHAEQINPDLLTFIQA